MDEMVNAWGCNFILSSARGHVSFHAFDERIRSTVPGFRLVKLTGSGTEANQNAIDRLTNNNIGALLIGMGSYVGGDEVLQPYSTTHYSHNKQISIPKLPSDCLDHCCRQTIALPYYAPGAGLTGKAAEIHDGIEAQCLNALHRKLLVGRMTSQPYKALLLEYILGGNGGELSLKFLVRLAELLTAFDVKIIVDEILTAGRVGPSILMTTTMPQELLKCVEFVTAGKVTDCGMVLQRVARKPEPLDERLRGVSTRIDASAAAHRWAHVQNRIESGFIPERRRQVLKEMGIGRDKERHWGRGCLIFTSFVRPWVMHGLKLRLLPMLEKMRIRKGNCKKGPWTCTTLTATLHASALSWIATMDELSSESSPFGCALIDYIGNSDGPKVLEFTDKEFLTDLGEKRSEEIAIRERKRVEDINRATLGRNTKCTRQPLTFVKELTNKATLDPPASLDGGRGFIKKRLGSKRIEKNIVDKDLLGFNFRTKY